MARPPDRQILTVKLPQSSQIALPAYSCLARQAEISRKSNYIQDSRYTVHHPPERPPF